MPIHEIGTLGRWKSSAVFRYIEEALQDIPLNAGVMPSQALNPMTPVPRTLAMRCQIRLIIPSGLSTRPTSKSLADMKRENTQKSEAKLPVAAVPERCWAVSTGRSGRYTIEVKLNLQVKAGQNLPRLCRVSLMIIALGNSTHPLTTKQAFTMLLCLLRTKVKKHSLMVRLCSCHT